MAHLRIKVCGLTSPADAAAVAALGADAVGLNFHPGSPRCVDLPRAEAILRALPPFVEAVGVFVERPLAEARALLRPLGRMATVQMHGGRHELPDDSPLPFVPAFAVRDEEGLRQVRRYLDACAAAGRMPAAVLVDGHAPGLHGGTGRTAPWGLVATLRLEVPLILAGGLTPDNVAEAVRAVRPYAVDVASGVESAPGKKDLEKVRRLIESARGA